MVTQGPPADQNCGGRLALFSPDRGWGVRAGLFGSRALPFAPMLPRLWHRFDALLVRAHARRWADNSMRIIIILFITAALPMAWLAADIRSSAKVRRILGLIAIAWSFAVAAFVGSLQHLNANSYFTSASKDLLEATVEQLRAGRTESVIRELSHANDRFAPTYENRGRYRQIVEEAIEGMRKP